MASSVAQMPTGDIGSPATAARRRQPQILDRWTALQAREMIVNIERQGHEAELSALSNVRASSRIQMWREMETEASPRGGGDGSASPGAEEAFGESDVESEKERGGVGKMVRTLSLKISSSWASSSRDESEWLAMAKQRSENRPTPATLRISAGGGKLVRVRGRKEMEDLVMRMKQERLREIAELAEGNKVSRFPFRGRIQLLIRLKFLRQEVATIKVIKHQQQQPIKFEAGELKRESNTIFFREAIEETSQHNVNEIGTVELTIDSQDSDSVNSLNYPETEDSRYTELVYTTELESSPEAFLTSLSRAEDLQENQGSDASWNERNLWEYSNDSKQTEDSSVSKSNQTEILMEETEAFRNCNWLLSEQAIDSNVEIRGLRERKTVSNFLSGDLPHKLNQLIMSFIEKQALQNVNVNGRDGRQNFEDLSDQDTSTSFNQYSSTTKQDEDVMNDLRDGFMHIQSELSELRKLVESCLEWQEKIEFSFKREFSSVVNQLVERGKSSPKTTRNDNCCICCESRVDTVLYRCGHMCACFKCSRDLQWNSGFCPICRSTIIDVVRIYPNI